MSPSNCNIEVEIKVLNPPPLLAMVYAYEAGKQLERRLTNLMAEQEARRASDAAYVSFAKAGHFFNTPAMTMLQLKAVTAEHLRLLTLHERAEAVLLELRVQLDKSFPPPPNGGEIVDIDGGDLILPVMDGLWKGQYLSWRPELGIEKHLRYPEPRGSHLILGRESGRLCWWTLKP